MKFPMKTIAALILSLSAACTHKVAVDDITVKNTPPVAYGASAFDERKAIAAETCDAQYKKGRQNYLAAVESRIAAAGSPDATKAPLDAFRAEINAAYNAVVQRCKTHMHCLEVQNYDEAKCYMAASDRKDAERRFSDLAEDLRRIERTTKRATARNTGKKPKPTPPVTVNNTYTPSVSQTQSQTQNNDMNAEARIEDRDILAVCGDAKNLLSARCRRACKNNVCTK